MLDLVSASHQDETQASRSLEETQLVLRSSEVVESGRTRRILCQRRQRCVLAYLLPHVEDHITDTESILTAQTQILHFVSELSVSFDSFLNFDGFLLVEIFEVD